MVLRRSSLVHLPRRPLRRGSPYEMHRTCTFPTPRSLPPTHPPRLETASTKKGSPLAYDLDAKHPALAAPPATDPAYAILVLEEELPARGPRLALRILDLREEEVGRVPVCLGYGRRRAERDGDG